MIIENHIGYTKEARDILRNDLLKHGRGICECQEQNGRVYFCPANEWLKGIVSSRQIVENKRGGEINEL